MSTNDDLIRRLRYTGNGFSTSLLEEAADALEASAAEYAALHHEMHDRLAERDELAAKLEASAAREEQR